MPQSRRRVFGAQTPSAPLEVGTSGTLGTGGTNSGEKCAKETAHVPDVPSVPNVPTSPGRERAYTPCEKHTTIEHPVTGEQIRVLYLTDPADVGDFGVRRLTPLEWERLQGFADNYTLIPYRGRPIADTPRYRAIGNSMAVPVMAVIDRRIHAVSAILSLPEQIDDQQTLSGR